MDIPYEAHCRYCGDSWEIDLSADHVSDEDFLEITRAQSVFVVCENCRKEHFGPS